MSGEVPTSTTARAPFDREDDDIIIRSSDNVDFHLFKAVLILASPFFGDMFSLKQPVPAEETSTIDPIPITEDAETFDCLMRLCYPIDDPPLDSDILLLEKVLEAAQKYLMSEATKIARVVLGILAQDFPLEVYAISCKLNLEKEARTAAEQWKSKVTGAIIGPAWGFESTLAGRSFGKNMHTITAGAYYRLVYFLRSPQVTGVSPATIRFVNGGDPAPTTFSMAALKLLFGKPSGQCLHDTTDADASLVSSDGVTFPVHSAILRLASAEGLLKPTPGDSESESESSTSPPSMHVNLRSNVLAELLRLCYPLQRVNTADLSLLHDVYTAANKWNMTKIMSFIKTEFRELIKLHSNPVSLYFIAVALEWVEEAQEVARVIARQGLQHAYAPEMEMVNATAYYNLGQFCYDFSTTARSALRNIVPRYNLQQGDTPPSSEALAVPVVTNGFSEMEPLSGPKCTHSGACGPGSIACQRYAVRDRTMRSLTDQNKKWNEAVSQALSQVQLKFGEAKSE